MEESGKFPERLQPKEQPPVREVLLFADQGKEANLQILPGKQWGIHYPGGGAVRAERLIGLKEGRYEPDAVAEELRPDALMYAVQDITEHGVQPTEARIRAITASIQYYNYKELAQFVTEFQGRDLSISAIQSLYETMATSRIQKKVMDAFGSTGRRQMESALKQEGELLVSGHSSTSVEKVLSGLKATWLSDQMQLLPTEKRDKLLQGLSPEETALYESLKGAYGEYVQRGDAEAYQQVVEGIKESIGWPLPKEVADEAKALEEELQEFADQAGPMQTPNDPAIPPEDEDEYHTQAPDQESKEQLQILFEIEPVEQNTPPLTGYYNIGRKSYYDPERLVWSKKKQITPYDSQVEGGGRQRISGTLDARTIALPIPTNYSVDAESLQFSGTAPTLYRDQTGCFYLESAGQTSFSAEFLPENAHFESEPIAQDVQLLYTGQLSPETEQIVAEVRGTASSMAVQVRDFLLSKHVYPGDGDLQLAQGLQHKLRMESDKDTYIHNLDASKYLECYSAATLFIALVRKIGIPARLVTGHYSDSVQNGKVALSSATGHAWAEIWNGQDWELIDPTPSPETPPAQNQPGTSGESQDSLGEISDADIQEAMSQLDETRAAMEKMQERKEDLNEAIQKAQEFELLQELADLVGEEELLEDMKENLAERVESKKQEMKQELRDQLEQMADDGFLDEEQRDKLLKQLEELEGGVLDSLQEKIHKESALYNEYEQIREEVMPLVEEWYRYFLERLPTEDEINTDPDSLSRRGTLDRRSTMRARNLIFGVVRNPRIINPVTKPLFLASILVDVSGSMAQGNKLKNARKLLVFYSELFSKLSEELGYLRFAINIFSDAVTPIKDYDQRYDSAERYQYPDGERSTVKVRLMERLVKQGGTNMLDGVKHAAEGLNKEVEDYPDYVSAFYFTGDGEDTKGNGPKIKEFLQVNDAEQGFGQHMYSAIFLGSESERKALADIFGDEHTNVASNLDQLVEQSMLQFDEDISSYLEDKVS